MSCSGFRKSKPARTRLLLLKLVTHYFVAFGYFIQFMNMQARSEILHRGQQNNRNFTNRSQLSKSTFKSKVLNTFKAQISAADSSPLSVANKARVGQCKTQESSPINQRVSPIDTVHFPQLFISGHCQSKQQVGSKERPFNVSKTVVILDSLIKLLKDQSKPFLKREKLYTQNDKYSNEFLGQQRRAEKMPKLVKNEVTKKFFQRSNKERKIQSQDKMRYNKNAVIGDKVGEYTFYGGNFSKLRLGEDILKEQKAQAYQNIVRRENSNK